MKISTYAVHVVLAFTYAGAFLLCYVYYLSFHYGAVGYQVYPQDSGFLALSISLSVAPIVFYRGFRAPSSALAVFTYLLLYVPIILTFALGSDRPGGEILLIQVTFMVSMCLLFLADVLLVASPFALDTSVDLTKVVFALTAAATAYMLFVYRGNLRLVSFADVYEQRFANVDLGRGVIVGYLAAWLYTVLVPLCLAYGLVARKYAYFFLGTGACVTIYMASAEKAAIVLPVVYLGVFLLFRGGRLRLLYPLLLGAMSLCMVVLAGIRDTTSLVFQVSSLVLMRTIGTGGVLTRQYYDFFLTHPHTLFTHVSIIGKITHAYPYGSLQIGQAVGQAYYSLDMNANANFWATDGIAAVGLAGVPLASIMCTLVFMVVNSATRSYNTLFVVLCFLPFLVEMFNKGLLTSVWSGGGFFLILFFLFNRKNPPGIGVPIPSPAARGT